VKRPQGRERGRSDADLAQDALQGSEQAWGEIVRRHRHRVVVALLARGIRLEDAEDLAQEAWTRLIEQARSGRLERLSLPGLAIAQAAWLALEFSRTRARHAVIAGTPVSLDTDPAAREVRDRSADPDDRAMHRERLTAIEEELSRCSKRAQRIFRAVYGNDAKSHADVAKELGISVQRVRQTLCEVRARLRQTIDKAEKESES
jgi:RNA polymerase sigma-70 factor (ECF subfamily)